MADKKISELDAITGSATAATDVFVVVDTSTGQTKKITREELNNAIEQDVLSTIDIENIEGDFSVNGNMDITGTVDGRDVSVDGTKLDGIDPGAEANAVDSVNTQTGAVVLDADDISDAATTNKFTTAGDISKLAGIEAGAEANLVDSVNTQTGAVVLDADDISDSATTNKFTTAGDISKLAGIEAGAEVNLVDSVNTQTGDVVLDADDISDAATTNKFTTAGDITKLAGIEALADVTDTANVTAAGAAMLTGATFTGGVTATTFTGDGSALTNLPSAGGVGSIEAWVNFNGTGVVSIRDSGNVSSITDNGTGDYSVNFTTSMPDANYSVQANASRDSNTRGGWISYYEDGTPPSTSSVRLRGGGLGGTSIIWSDRSIVAVNVVR